MTTPPTSNATGLAARLARLDRKHKALVFGGEVVLFLAVWQVVVGQWRLVNATFFPPPLSVLDGLVDLVSSGTLTEHALTSVQSWVTGFALAAAIGIPLGLLMGSSLPVDRIVGPLAWTIYATPMLAYQPLSKAWFGFGTGPVVFLVVIAAVFPILLNVSAGIRTTNPSLISAGRVYGGSRFQLYRKVLLPSTVAFLFAGLRQAAVMATIGMIAAELTGSSTGMGALIMRTSNTYNTAQSFAAIGLVVLWSVAMTQLISGLGRWWAPWTRTGGRS
ncbi:ABC transporter permease [Pseudonocardia kunmingensis]|uniref:NitT/TauT family transport system permease protein n=1 Tax=Pseudonocardia kunmingensis TaxID=630975 RepID=A0A543DQJ7_9PSEU|nr:ABC transporter permease [Pseudonocardia kunmingensis]TQM11594.1 NitT/TauT family transport system permease protein [Pseudonocardia kunmingensis]